MKTRTLKPGNLQKYSFKDLEYGLKIVNSKLEDLKTTLRVLETINRNKKIHVPDFLKAKLLEEAKEFEQVISLVQDEIANRLLTGNDDGAVMKELLGANHV